jgi:hypothetical protein
MRPDPVRPTVEARHIDAAVEEMLLVGGSLNLWAALGPTRGPEPPASKPGDTRRQGDARLIPVLYL